MTKRLHAVIAIASAALGYVASAVWGVPAPVVAAVQSAITAATKDGGYETRDDGHAP